jgi:hypothetical protein
MVPEVIGFGRFKPYITNVSIPAYFTTVDLWLFKILFDMNFEL